MFPPTHSVMLAFCGPAVDPDVVTRIMGLQPSYALRCGQKTVNTWSDKECLAQNGQWEFITAEFDSTKDFADYFAQSFEILASKVEALKELKLLGYEAILDCILRPSDLACEIEPEHLERMAMLGLTLNVWAFNPEWQSAYGKNRAD